MPELPERYTINRPIRFAGTDAEREANFRSHDWITYDPEEVPECGRCCAKTWHAAASYRCGEEPPRETIEVGG
jgi:hypothetical protein